jgi:hypothetical protein
MSSISMSDVLNPKVMLPSFILGTPLAIVAGAVSAVAFGIIGTALLACSAFDPSIYEGAKDGFRLAGYGVALIAIGLVNIPLLGIPVAITLASMTYPIEYISAEEAIRL